MTILWTATAVGHLAAIHEYISQTSPFYADRMVQRILARGPQLTTFPDSGRAVPEVGRSDIREVIEGPYRVIYRVTESQVAVLAVVHGRQARIGPLPQ
ncbi:MAG: type II toxin-antitoxin system RelE/ParE family toxin [Gemmatimonadetes bacterium]|nr:type II toxin-antitoxin system RelE/ParE family toxin [Gemmatimonadota bacterium]MBK6780794.1 type II toxin-antitoxin system RelE/ParE family toxin [Gemmatimonadota bacterium]MBK7717562.1 type II toxin-antitoxin system RelE/ParE family toxin [Gemmatimonadota bacterium]MBK7786940.1 type II toxin-antitoxin system RelE/ParE family toxin [Gemmatimonadota bacterium]MBK7922182.1 type II toxin-antitoxin system RelE/ParE family toxin [Gemmatimonadota bacterium]